MLPSASALAPRVVSFDCWNTLLYEPNWPVAHGLRVTALHEAAAHASVRRNIGRDAAGEAFDAGWHRHMELWEQGVASGAAEVARWAFEALDILPKPEVLRELIQHFEEASHSHSIRALPGARDTLEGLVEHGIGCALICDTGLTPGRVVRKHLEHLGLREFLPVTIFSDEEGAPKPDARMFMAALAPFGEAPANAVHVGDLKRTDVAGARGAGMVSVRLTERHDDDSALPEADHVVASHFELLRLLTAGL